jgi:hypothetical protein
MATLTETSYYARRAINWSILGVIAYFILKIIWIILVTIYLILFPPKPPPPNHAFGVLPSIKFPQQASPSAQITYKLETIEGTVPKASESGTVYFMPKSAPDFLALNRTQTFAGQLQLSPNPVQESKNIYRFNDTQYSLRTMRYDIVTSNFVLRYAYNIDTGVFNNTNLPKIEDVIAESQDILDKNKILPTDFKGGRTQTEYLTLVGNSLVQTASVIQANAIRVDFLRDNINGLQVFYPDPASGPISFIYSGATDEKKHMLEFNYIYWPVDYESKATYGLKTSAQAWQELTSGGGYIAQRPKNGTEYTVRQVQIGYYDSIEPQSYLQPVFVFTGDNGFVAYVSAVAPPWTQ